MAPRWSSSDTTLSCLEDELLGRGSDNLVGMLKVDTVISPDGVLEMRENISLLIGCSEGGKSFASASLVCR